MNPTIRNVSIVLLGIFILGCTSLKMTEKNDKNFLKERKSVRFMFYNVENLFDTLDSPDTRDEEFLPDGDKRWTSYRYYAKLQKLSKVIIGVGGWQPPEMIGLCEVENRRVLNDLIHLTPLKEYDYDIIHKESPDFRGIDNAFLYRRSHFEPLFYDYYTVKFPFSPETTTREILYVKGLLEKTDTIHVFVNHFPSRRGGKEESEPKRVFVANILKSKVDSLLSLDPDAKIIITGDFNDEPGDKSLNVSLGAGLDSLNYNSLYNLMSGAYKKGEGSYKYKFEWNTLDQIILSRSFFNGEGYSANYHAGVIFRADWLMTDDQKYNGKRPDRTYLGPRYVGGYSDHLPVFFDLVKK